MVTIAPYGTWVSPISPEDAAAAGGSPQWVDFHAGDLWWAQTRPAEAGRVALLRAGKDVLGQPWNVRNRVHEYGGRPYTMIGNHHLVFTHWDDQRLYRLDLDGGLDGDDAVPVPISPEPERPAGFRYAEPTAGPALPDDHSAEVWCVRETITGDARTDVRRDLVAVPLDGSAAGDPARVRTLAASHHFLTGPKPSPDGRHVAWIGWDHPAMPWDGTELCVAEVDDHGVLGEHRVLAGGPDEAVIQVEWEGPSWLLVLTDPDGWWNLHRIGLDGATVNLAATTNEVGGAMWRLGSRWFAPLGGGRHAVLNGNRLAILDELTATVTDVDTELSVWSPTIASDGLRIASAAGSPALATAVVELDTGSSRLTEHTAQPDDLPDPAYLPMPETRIVTGPDGHAIPAYVYPPTNPDFGPPLDELPPYLVSVHGGPTSHATASLDLGIAFFTSRGIGVVVPNYGGSTGHGRVFRERLRGQWGVVDVADCAAVARALGEEGIADPRRLVISGGSAGGWTAAAALTTADEVARSTFRAGTAMFPILDPIGWATGETHDFESRYLDSLIGPLPEARERYDERSPAGHVDRLAGPILIMQGLDDQICPPEQADRFVAALAGSGIPHAYLGFEGEQHGFRKAETIRTALAAELSFVGQVLGFTPPGIPTLELNS